MPRPRILLIDNDPSSVDLLIKGFTEVGFDVNHVFNEFDLKNYFKKNVPDVVILDLYSTSFSGLDIFKLIRTRMSSFFIPIVILTSEDKEVNKVQAFEMGATDYIVKPCSIPEILARVGSILRRSAPLINASIYMIGDLVIDLENRNVRRGSRLFSLSPLDFKLLSLLAQRPGQVFKRSDILLHVWGEDSHGNERRVDVQVRRLRIALNQARERDPVITIRNVGYSFDKNFGRGFKL